MNDKQASALWALVVVAMIGLPALAGINEYAPSDRASDSGFINAPPATAAGLPSSPMQVQDSSPATVPAIAPAPERTQETDLGGTAAAGRVAQVYVKVADNVFLAVDRAPDHLRASAERWVEVQFPEMLANDTGAARAALNRSDSAVRVGDVVAIRFAHRDNSRFFPVKEFNRVTEVVATRNQMLAKDFERRIFERNDQRPPLPGWLSQTSASPAGHNRLQ